MTTETKFHTFFALAALALAVIAISLAHLLGPSSAPDTTPMATPAFCGKVGHPVYSMIDTNCFRNRKLSY